MAKSKKPDPIELILKLQNRKPRHKKFSPAYPWQYWWVINELIQLTCALEEGRLKETKLPEADLIKYSALSEWVKNWSVEEIFSVNKQLAEKNSVKLVDELVRIYELARLGSLKGKDYRKALVGALLDFDVYGFSGDPSQEEMEHMEGLAEKIMFSVSELKGTSKYFDLPSGLIKFAELAVGIVAGKSLRTIEYIRSDAKKSPLRLEGVKKEIIFTSVCKKLFGLSDEHVCRLRAEFLKL